MGSDLDDIIDKGLEQLQAENARLKDRLAESDRAYYDAAGTIEQLKAIVAKSERAEMLDKELFSIAPADLKVEFYHNAANAARQMEERLKQATQREARLREALARIANHGPMMLARGEYRRGQMDMLGGIVRIAKQALEEAGT